MTGTFSTPGSIPPSGHAVAFRHQRAAAGRLGYDGVVVTKMIWWMSPPNLLDSASLRVSARAGPERTSTVRQ